MPTILYAEDDLDQVKMMRILLEKQGYNFLEAKDGAEAIKKIKSVIPDLVLLDLFMPFVDGFGVLKAVKGDPLTAHIPVIILSAWPTGDNRERTTQAGAAQFVAKPYVPSQFVEIIERHLSPGNTEPLTESTPRATDSFTETPSVTDEDPGPTQPLQESRFFTSSS